MNSRFAGLHVLADDNPCWNHDPVVQAEAACKAGAHVIQLRTKTASDACTLEWARAIRSVTRQFEALFVVNDRFDLAMASEADAVHLGQNDLPPSSVPSKVRRKLAIGRSTHTLPQIVAAKQEPVDYLAFGPVFGTQSKSSQYSARGLHPLCEAARMAAPYPLVAIGGIDSSNLEAVIKSGADGVAVISAIASVADPQVAAHQLVSLFEQARKSFVNE